MPGNVPPAQLLRTFVRPDERQTLFILLAEGGIQIVEDTELWGEPHQDEDGACYAYYPTVFPEKRFANLDAALRHARKYYRWIDATAETSDGFATMNRMAEPAAVHDR
jgi:hypothetical protein